MDAPAGASVADHDSPPAKVDDKTKTNEDEVSIIRCDTSSGPFTMKLIQSWSPLGYDRATDLFRIGYYDNSHFYSVVPELSKSNLALDIHKQIHYGSWPMTNNLLDDPQLDPPIPFEEGTIAFAGSGNNTRHVGVVYCV